MKLLNNMGQRRLDGLVLSLILILLGSYGAIVTYEIFVENRFAFISIRNLSYFEISILLILYTVLALLYLIGSTLNKEKPRIRREKNLTNFFRSIFAKFIIIFPLVLSCMTT